MLAPLVIGVVATVFDSRRSEESLPWMWVLAAVYGALQFRWVTGEVAVLVDLAALAGFLLLVQGNSRLLVRDTNWAQEVPSTVRQTRRATTPNSPDTTKELVPS